MQTLNLPKVDGVSTEPAAEYNSFAYELQNIITSSGQTLDGANLNQIGIASAIYAAGSDYYVDSGAANAYVLSVVGSKKAPNSYFDGMTVRFLPTNSSNAASTVNVASLGVKNIRSNVAGAAIPHGAITANVEVILTYNLSLGAFVLQGQTSQIKQQYSQVYLNAPQTIDGDNVPVIVNFNTVIADANGWWDNSLKKFTPTLAGLYEVKATLFSTDSSIATYNIYIELYIDGVRYIRLAQASNSVAEDEILHGSTQIVLSGSQNISLHVTYSTVGTNTIEVGQDLSSNRFEIRYLGAI